MRFADATGAYALIPFTDQGWLRNAEEGRSRQWRSRALLEWRDGGECEFDHLTAMSAAARELADKLPMIGGSAECLHRCLAFCHARTWKDAHPLLARPQGYERGGGASAALVISARPGCWRRLQPAGANTHIISALPQIALNERASLPEGGQPTATAIYRGAAKQQYAGAGCSAQRSAGRNHQRRVRCGRRTQAVGEGQLRSPGDLEQPNGLRTGNHEGCATVGWRRDILPDRLRRDIPAGDLPWRWTGAL